MTHVHLIGIGGTGLSAIARVLLESGYTVSGSDRQSSPLAQSLLDSGVKVFIGHRPENIQGADLVVRSSAVSDENIEVHAANRAGIPVLKRADFLGRLMEGKQRIAVAGTHGKTTTTAMIAWMLTALQLDPSFIIGGVPANLKTNAHAGQGSFFVIEADEYDRMFLGLNPDIAVITNIEHDHPDCYPTNEEFYQAFREFTGLIDPSGVLLACGDDRGAARLLVDVSDSGRRAAAYGLECWLGRPRPDYWGIKVEPNERGGFDFDMRATKDGRRTTNPAGLSSSVFRPSSSIHVSLQVPGMHNVRNALAALAVADLLDLPLNEAAQALNQFKGTGRRFEIRGEAGGVVVIDDYAHHPTEIRATLAAARARYPRQAIWAVWQPHTYSRSRALLDDFATSFGDADHIIVTEIYAAREAPPGDFTSQRIVEALSHQDVIYIPDLASASQFLVDSLQPDDVLLVLSAGDADQISGLVLEGLSKRSAG